MANPDEIRNRAADPFVQARSGAAGSAKGLVALAGLLGDSDRAGRRRLYLTTRLDYFAEFRTADVVAVEDVPPTTAPFPGLDATRVLLAGDAAVDWVRRTSGADPFLLEAREATVQPEVVERTHTWQAACPAITVRFGQSDFDPCRPGGGGTGGGTFGPWPSQAGPTCGACTQDSCATCGQNTCDTCVGETCATCQGPRCATVPNTCQTCGRATCEPGCVVTAMTCVSCAGSCDETCASCWNTCLGTCVSCRGTCDATCANTCVDSCANTCGATCWATCETCHTCNFVTCDCRISDPAWCAIRA